MIPTKAVSTRYLPRVSNFVRESLPRGEPLAPDVWSSRHRGFVIFLWAQAVGLAVFGVIRGYSVLHSIGEAAIVAVAAGVASLPNTSRAFRSVVATVGLMSASAILVHLSGGTIEAHFHFFVMISLITLYQDWTPFLVSIAYVVLHHATAGMIAPESVFNHPAAIQNPIRWALLHGAFVLGASVAGMLIWRRNEDLREQERTQSLVNRSLTTFNSRVAHDLKSPLMIIKGAASTGLGMLDSPENIRTVLEMIHQQAGRGQTLVTSLLELAKANGKPNPERISTRIFLEEVVADFPQLDAEIADVPYELFADPRGLRQAVTNLLMNAEIHASREDRSAKVTIQGDEAPDGWRLVVRDDGPGISGAEVETIFHPLVRGAGATREGSGLGLSIVEAVAEAHGGRVWYQPAKGGGSEFWMYFPRPDSGAPPNQQEMEPLTA